LGKIKKKLFIILKYKRCNMNKILIIEIALIIYNQTKI
jgi:hypothetical protein